MVFDDFVFKCGHRLEHTEEELAKSFEDWELFSDSKKKEYYNIKKKYVATQFCFDCYCEGREALYEAQSQNISNVEEFEVKNQLLKLDGSDVERVNLARRNRMGVFCELEDDIEGVKAHPQQYCHIPNFLSTLLGIWDCLQKIKSVSFWMSIDRARPWATNSSGFLAAEEYLAKVKKEVSKPMIEADGLREL